MRSGYVRWGAVLTALVLAAVLAFPARVMASETESSYSVEVEIPVTVSVDGSDAPEESFTIVLEAVTTDAPMPDTKTLTCTAGSTVSFGPITFTSPGNYQYKISQTAGSTTYMTYDDTVIYVTVQVTNEVDSEGNYTGKLTAVFYGYADDDDGFDEDTEEEGDSSDPDSKLSSLSFVNSYDPPSSDDGGSDDDGGDDDSDPTPSSSGGGEEGGSVLGAIRDLVETLTGGGEEGGSVLGAERAGSTGDDSNLLLWLIVALACAVGIGYGVRRIRKPR